MRPDFILEKARELAAIPIMTHSDGIDMQLFFQWLDEAIMAGKFPTDYIIAFRRGQIDAAIAESEKEVVPDAEVVTDAS